MAQNGDSKKLTHGDRRPIEQGGPASDDPELQRQLEIGRKVMP